MKKICLAILMVCCVASLASAEPWLVCNPQDNTDGFIYSLNGGPEGRVPYTTRTFSDGLIHAVIADLGPLPDGPFTFSVRAYNAWGQSSTVPFRGIETVSWLTLKSGYRKMIKWEKR